MPIHSFADRTTERLFREGRGRGIPPDILKRAMRVLDRIEAAASLSDLARVPGAKLEKLHRDRSGQYSVRVNDQWRICFCWDEGAHDVELTDYH
jgi:proteic killer suppression protein